MTLRLVAAATILTLALAAETDLPVEDGIDGACAAYYHASHARSPPRARLDVQLCVAGAAHSERSSAPGNSRPRRGGAGRHVARVRPAVCHDGTTVDPAGAAAARAIAAGLLLDPQRAVADGAAGLQPAVSLVRG